MIKDTVKFVLLVALIVIPVRTFVAQPFVVNGASMNPTFEHGDYLIVDQISYRFNTPNRGEVVVFRYPEDPSQFFIKRVVGLPDETIEIDGENITIYNDAHPDGQTLEEPYTKTIKGSRPEHATTELKNNEYFVLGDNRQQSSDSRTWGPLPEDNIVGRPLFRLFPPSLPPPIFPGSYQNDH